MHLPIPEQERYLRLVPNGFCNYYAVPTNFRVLFPLTHHALQAALSKATQPAASAAHWLPSPKLPRNLCGGWRAIAIPTATFYISMS
jgi:hypothetical protein